MEEKNKTQPKKERGSGLLVGGILLGIVILLALVGLGYFFYWNQVSEAEELINQADKHWERANKLFVAAEAFEMPQEVASVSFKEWAEENQQNATEAKKEVELVQQKLERVKTLRIRDWMQEYAKKRIKATNEMIEGLEIFEKWNNRIARRIDPLENLYEARRKYDEGLLAINKTISFLNKDEFSGAKNEAQKAKKSFDDAKNLLSEASQKDKNLKLDNLIRAAQKEIQRSRTFISLAEEQKKDVDRYNQLIDQANKLKGEGKELLKKNRKFFYDPLRWYRTKLSELEKESLKHLARSNELEEEAVDLWNQNI